MTLNPNWHAAPELLAGYAAGALGRTQAASVEAHLVTCASCRSAMTPLAAPGRLEHNLTAITARADQPERPRLERLLEHIGVPEHIVRALAVTPLERGAWLTGVAVALLVAAVAEVFTGSERTLFVFLVAAPLVPLAGVASAVTFRRDPLRELVTAAPTPGFKLFLIRALAVLAPTIVVAAAASLLVPGRGWASVLWLLPSFGLAATTLALGTWCPIRAVAWTLGATWTAAATVAVRGAPNADPVGSFVAFRPVGQLTLLALSLVAAAVATVRRDSFDLIGIGRTP